jgi:hypothetical protein
VKIMERDTPKSSQHPTTVQLARMQQAGRLTAAEAAALKSADDGPTRDAVLGGIRARHIAARLEGAVADGRIVADQAQALAERARKGEHSRDLRAAVNRALKAEPKPDTGASS